MRKKPPTWPCIVIICIIAITSCNQIKETPINIAVDSTLSQDPPTATDISIKALEKPTEQGNVLVTTRLSGINTSRHAVMVGDEKLTLHDDGEAGDAKANDGIFSIILNEDLNEFVRELTQQKNQLLTGPQIKFVNRHAVTIPVEKFKEITIDTVLIRRGVTIPMDFFTPSPDPLLKGRSLMITDLKVVTDKTRTFNTCLTINPGTANGVWTFSRLVSNMANGTVTPENFVREWLDQWMNDQPINSDQINARKQIFNIIIVPWIRKTSPSANPTDTDWKTFPLDLTKAPFRLEAIVNRLDLRGNIGYSARNAGEGRFVFSVLGNSCNPMPFMVIFEYGIPKRTCSSIKAFAQQWFDLKNMTPGTTQYNDALQAITDQFTKANASPGKPNGSALNQIRTNEISLNSPWQLREFKISAISHTLQSVVVANEPAEKFNSRAGATQADATVLARYVNNNADDIIAQRHSVPISVNGIPFQGAKAHTLTSDHFWNGEQASTSPAFIQRDSARHFLSLNTCSGCHGGEGKTSVGNLINDPAGIGHSPFLQIAPHVSTKATLAAFLTGDPNDAEKKFRVNDPANRPSAAAPIEWTFNDLERRAQDLDDLVNRSCLRRLPGLIHVLRFKPLNMIH